MHTVPGKGPSRAFPRAGGRRLHLNSRLAPDKKGEKEQREEVEEEEDRSEGKGVWKN